MGLSMGRTLGNRDIPEHIYDRERESLFKINQQQREKIGILQAQKRLQARKIRVMEKTQAALRDQIRQESETIEAQKQELSELRSYVFGTGERYAIQTDAAKSGRQYREWRERNVIVVGGHEGWQYRLKELFPNWQFVCGTQRNIAPEHFGGKKYIVCNIQVLSRACYDNILACRSREQKILYVRSSNMEQCLQELERQLE